MTRFRSPGDEAARTAAIDAGAKHYRGVSPCGYGHQTPLRNLRGSCCHCRRVRDGTADGANRGGKARSPADELARDAARKAGAKRYRSDTPCRNGHDNPERLAISGSCCQCTSERGLERAAKLAAERETERVEYEVEEPAPVNVEAAKGWQPSGFIRALTTEEMRAGNARRVGR